MNVLCIDTSCAFASVAVLGDGQLLAEAGVRAKARVGDLLLPLVDRVLRLAELDLRAVDAIAIGLGPGGFTSLRVGLATAKGLCLAHDCPIVGVSSLQALARGLGAGPGVAVAMTDAQRGEVFAAAYRFGDGASTTARTGPATSTGPAASAGPAASSPKAGTQTLVAPLLATPEVAVERILAGVAAAGLGGEARESARMVVGGDALAAYGDVLRAAFGASTMFAPPSLGLPRAALVGAEALFALAARGPDDLGALEPLYVRSSDAKLPATPLRVG